MAATAAQPAASAGSTASVDASLVAAPAPTPAPVQTAAATLGRRQRRRRERITIVVTKNVTGKSSSFDVALNPAGLGHVNVKIEINSAGQVSASLSFSNAQTAADARSHAGDLQQALERPDLTCRRAG